MMRSGQALSLLVAILSLVSCDPDCTSRITAIVTDQSGAPISRARVTIEDACCKEFDPPFCATSTDSEGKASFLATPDGASACALKAEKPGFMTAMKTVAVPSRCSRTVDALLTLQAIQ
jgi:hypothetical protein